MQERQSNMKNEGMVVKLRKQQQIWNRGGTIDSRKCRKKTVGGVHRRAGKMMTVGFFTY